MHWPVAPLILDELSAELASCGGVYTCQIATGIGGGFCGKTTGFHARLIHLRLDHNLSIHAFIIVLYKPSQSAMSSLRRTVMARGQHHSHPQRSTISPAPVGGLAAPQRHGLQGPSSKSGHAPRRAYLQIAQVLVSIGVAALQGARRRRGERSPESGSINV